MYSVCSEVFSLEVIIYRKEHRVSHLPSDCPGEVTLACEVMNTLFNHNNAQAILFQKTSRKRWCF